jgi:cell division protein FtsB
MRCGLGKNPQRKEAVDTRMFGKSKKKRLNLALPSSAGGNRSALRSDLKSRLSNSGARVRRILFRVTVVFAFGFLIYTFFGGTYGFLRIARLHAQKKEVERVNRQLLIRLINADYTRYRLENDLEYIEYIARTRHFFARPGETIYRFKE